MFPSPNSSSSLPCLSDFNFHSSTYPLDFSSIFQQPSFNNMDQPHMTTTSMADDVIKAKKQAAPRKRRASKKDRHSKIYTAKGLRDRRMRLSLDVARRFFDLQDMLGFDKGSRTVEWLLNQSEPSIEQVKKTQLIGNEGAICTMMDCSSKLATRSSSSPSITWQCDAACHENIFDKIINSRESGSAASRAKIVRESRKMARARAKERRMEKMWIQSLESSNINGSKAPPHHESCVEEPELGQSLLITYNMKLPSMEQHDVLVVGAAHDTQEHLYTDLQLLTKPWEAFNSGRPSYLC